MKILVFVKEVPDVRVPIAYDESGERVRTEWNVAMLDPNDRSAIQAALKMKGESPDSHVTIIHLAPPSGERVIREALALGCDEGIRVWGEELEEVHSQGKALVFARTAAILGFDCILTGARSMDTGNGQTGPLLAAHLRMPYVGSVLALEKEAEKGIIIAMRRLDRGYRERVAAPLPLVVGMEASDETPEDGPLPLLLGALEKEIPCFDCTDLGISGAMLRELEGLLSYGPLRPPKARLKSLPAPDPSLPAFVRIQKLIGGAAVPREGRIVKGEEDYVAEEFFRILYREGWLDHLRRGEK